MAKKKFGELLKELLGSKLDEEIDLGDESTDSSGKEDETVKNNKATETKDDKVEGVNVGNVTKEVDASDKKDKEEEKIEKAEENDMTNIKMFEDGWFDKTSGKVDFGKIKNPEAVEAIKALTDMYEAEKEQRLISDSLNEELKNYSLNVSEETLKKVLDTSGVKIDKEGKVVGIKEAIDSLKASEPGFFKDKDKESNPLNEGFSPVEKPTATTEDELVNLAYCQ